MTIFKTELQDIIDELPDFIDVDELIDKILIVAKIRQGIAESDQELGQDWDEFKKELRSL